MAASYPAGFDTMSDPASNLSGPPTHSSMHNQINDVVEAIEAELGLNPSGASATITARFTAIDAAITALQTLTTATAWTAVTFANSWVDYGTGIQTCQYRKIGDIVYLRGYMKDGTMAATAFTLPSGFRPPMITKLSALSNTLGSMTVDPSGTVTPNGGTNTNFGIDAWFSVTS